MSVSPAGLLARISSWFSLTILIRGLRPWQSENRLYASFDWLPKASSMQYRESPHLDPSAMELYIETLTGTAFELRVSPFETIISVKAKIQRIEGIPISQQHLVWQSKELEDDCCLQDYRITDGATIKLVLAMRGGPINTRRVPVEDPAWREMMDYVEANREEIWEKLPGGRQVTLLVFRDGDQINFFRVIDRGDGTLSPLSESLSSSMRTLSEEEREEVIAQERILENAVTLQKMRSLRKKMEALNIKKKPKKPRNYNQVSSRPSSRGTTHHVVAVKPKIHNPGYSLNKHSRLPPVNSKRNTSPTNLLGSQVTESLESDLFERSPRTVKTGETSWAEPKTSPIQPMGELLPAESSMRVANTGTIPKIGTTAPLGSKETVAEGIESTRHQVPSFSALEAYRRSLLQLRANVSAAATATTAAATTSFDTDLLEEHPDPSSTTISKPSHVGLHRSNLSANGRRRMFYTNRHLDSMNAEDLHHTLAKLDPRISVGPTTTSTVTGASNNNIGNATGGGRERTIGKNVISQHRILERVQSHPRLENLGSFRPRTSPENGIKEQQADVSHASREICEILSRTRAKLKSQGANERRRAHSFDFPNDDLGIQSNRVRKSLSPELELVASTDSRDLKDDLFKTLSSENLGTVSDGLSFENPRLQKRLTVSRQGRLNSSHKLPPVTITKKIPVSSSTTAVTVTAAAIVPRCQVCNKKTGLATSYTCRCGKNFCASHRYAETHSCTFDYKTEGRKMLEQSNPMVAAPKLPKI